MSQLLTLQDDKGGFEFVGNAFKITGAVADIDGLNFTLNHRCQQFKEGVDLKQNFFHLVVRTSW